MRRARRLWMAILPRHACRMRMSDGPQFNADLFDSATRALTLTVDHMTIFGRNSAEERLAWLLIMLQGRSTLPELCPAVVELAMQRPGYCRLPRFEHRNDKPDVHSVQGAWVH